jgi:hypothetical protein
MTEPPDAWGALVEAEVEGLVDCECCDKGVSYTTGRVCVACNGTGWREP